MTNQIGTESDGTFLIACVVKHNVLLILVILELKCFHQVLERNLDVQPGVFSFSKELAERNQFNVFPVLCDEMLSKTYERVQRQVSPHVGSKTEGETSFFGREDDRENVSPNFICFAGCVAGNCTAVSAFDFRSGLWKEGFNQDFNISTAEGVEADASLGGEIDDSLIEPFLHLGIMTGLH